MNTSALSSKVVLDSPISKEHVGRSIIIKSSKLDDSIIGKSFLVYDISDDGLSFTAYNPDTLQENIFTASSSSNFIFAPSVGFDSRKVFTNLKHQKFRIFVNNEEVGSTIYDIDEEGIFEIDSDLEYLVKTRINISKNAIEFIKKENGVWSEGVSQNDLIHIKSYGLSMILVNSKLEISSEGSTDGVSIIKTNLPSPIDYRDVNITKVLEPRFIPDFEIISES